MNEKSQRVNASAVLDNFRKALSSRVSNVDTVDAVIEKIHHWAGDQPFLTKLLCHYVIKRSEAFNQRNDATIVDEIVDDNILSDWEKNGAAIHFKRIQRMLLDYKAKNSLLIEYLQLLQRDSITVNNTPEQTALLETGLATRKGNQLILTNPIYANVFDTSWVEKQVPGITKPVAVLPTSPQPLSSPQPKKARPSSSSSSPSKIYRLGVIGCGIALLAAIAAAQFRRPVSSVLVNVEADSSAPVETATPEVTRDVTRKGITQLSLLGDTFSGYSTFRNEDFQAALDEVGLKVKYADEFDQAQRARRLSEGSVDLMVTTLDQFLQQRPKGKIVGLLDRTVGADAVVLNTKQFKGLTSLDKLSELVAQRKEKGEPLSIAYAADTPSEYLALVLDTRFDTFNLSDFELKPVADASEAWALMQKSKENVAVAVLWEPFITQAQQDGYSVVLSSEDAPNAIVDVIVASDRLVESQPQALSQLLESYYRRIDANVRDASQLQAQVAEDGDLSVADAAAIIAGIDFFTATEAQGWLTDGTMEKRIRSTAAVLALSNRLAKVPEDPSALFTEKFVAQAASNTQALIDMVRADNPELADKLAGQLNTAITPSAATGEASDSEPNAIAQSPTIGNLQIRGKVEFNTDSAQLTEEGKRTLDQIAEELKEFNEDTVAVRIIGHTSQAGDAAANQALSQARASAAAQHLKGVGVGLSIQPEGRGFSEPLANVDPFDPRNQRTEIQLVRVN